LTLCSFAQLVNCTHAREYFFTDSWDSCLALPARSKAMPPDLNWKQWRQGELRTVREAVGGLHELRSAYACERYEAITGHAAPCAGGQILDKDVDYGARLVISEELGHGRTDVVSEYVGGRK